MLKSMLFFMIALVCCPALSEGNGMDGFLCNKNCEVLEEVSIFVYDESGNDLSYIGGLLKRFIDENMEAYRRDNANIIKSTRDPMVTTYYEKNKLKLPFYVGFSPNRWKFCIVIEVKPDGFDPSVLNLDLKLFSQNYTYINTVQCKKSSVEKCTKSAIETFSNKVIGDYLFKENLKEVL